MSLVVCTKSGESATEIISTSVGVVNSPYSTRLSDSHRQFESTSALDVPITMDSSLIMKSDETVLKQFGHTSSESLYQSVVSLWTE